MTNLPDNWMHSELGDILDIQGGSQPPKSTFLYSPKDGYVQLLQIRDYGERSVPTYVPIKKVSKFCKKDDVLIARYGASLGRIVTGQEGAYNVALAKVIDLYKVFNKRYIFYLLKTSVFQTPLSLLSRSAQNGFAKHEIAHIQLPIPPLAEQHRIVAKIEELFCELDKGVETLKTAQEQLKVYRQAVLKYAFEGKLTNPHVKDGELPKGWELKKLEDLSQTIGGIAFKSTDFLPSGKYQVIRMGNIRPGVIRYNESPVFLNDVDEKILDKGLLRNNDIVISQTGTKGKRDYGFTTIIMSPDLLLNQRLAAIRCSSLLNPKFLLYFTWTDAFRDQFFANETGNVGQGNVGIKGITQSFVPFPSFTQQEIIVQEIESRLSVCDKIEESIQQGLQQAEALRQSILKKAFEGKLVPQGPNDEPASVLLERIKAERAFMQPVKKTKTKKAKKLYE